MEITKIINNNIVCSLDEQGQELILTGCGIGFKRKVGDSIDESKVEKTYKQDNQQDSNKMQELLADIPLEHMNTCDRIIEYAKSNLTRKLTPNIYITLTDHISFAIKRHEDGLVYKNELLWEIKKFYPKEFNIGKEALHIIEEELKVRLSEDEAGFIAFHFVNAQLGTNMENTVNITELIHDVLCIVKNYYQIEMDEDSLFYERFITHLKFFGQRIFQKKDYQDEDHQFHSMIKRRYERDYECAMRIKKYVFETFGFCISEEEMMYLTVHLKRLTQSTLEDE